MPERETPSGHLPSSTHPVAWSPILSRVWPQQPCRGGGPPQDPPSCTPLGAGSQILSRAWTRQPCRGGKPPRTPPLEHAPWCWVTDFVSCLATAAVPGGGDPPRPPHEHAPWCWVTYFVSCLDTAAVSGNPPRTPPSSTPLGAGSQILSHAWTQQPWRETPPDPPVEHAPWCWFTDLFTFFQKCPPSGERLNH